MNLGSKFPKARGDVVVVVWRPIFPKLKLAKFDPDKYRCVGVRPLKGNVVVDNAVKQMARLLGGFSPTDRYINRMQFGTSNTGAASSSDTALESPITPIKTITSTTYPTDSSVRFQAFLLEDEANGFPLKEAGLLFANTSPLLAARKTFETLSKTSDFVFEWNWTIYW